METAFQVLPVIFWTVALYVGYKIYMEIMSMAHKADTQTELLREILAELKESNDARK